MNREKSKNGENTGFVLWLICPICKQSNPAGTLHCQHCWGASLYSVVPITTQELRTIEERRARQQGRVRVWRTILVAVVAPVLLASVIVLYLSLFTDVIFGPSADINSVSMPGEWAMYRHDVNRTGSGDGEIVNPTGTLKWSFQADAPVYASPVFYHGIVYFGSSDYKLYAVDAATGSKIWEFATGSWVQTSPAVVDGVLYFGSNDGKFYALDAASGEELWDFRTRYVIVSSPAVANGVVYFGADDSNIYALDCKTGAKIWSFNTGSEVGTSPVVVNGILYASGSDGSCYAIDARNGRLRLRMRTFETLAGPVVGENAIFFGSPYHLFAVDGNARNWPGELSLRSYWLQLYVLYLAPPPPPISGYLWAMRLPVTSHAAPVIDGDTLYTGSYDKLVKVDLTTRKTIWEFEVDNDINSSPTLENNRLYVGCDDGRLYAVDANNGEKLWDFQTGARILSSPIYADGVIYVTSEDGSLYAIE